MRLKVMLISVCLATLSFSSVADVATSEQHLAATNSEQPIEKREAKQCLKELEEDKIAKEDDNKSATQEPTWLEKTFNYHKLGSLHFQDIIELFY
ncbi:MAG: hypothetical protein HWE27_03645 [Gammaproteobacteria bacterium]|nr:hypothetical protein [Gammaproteobacteria bacterium]